MDKGIQDIELSFANYKQDLRDLNLFKHLDNNDNLKRLNRARSAYKNKLVDKILEKGSRASRINESKTIVSQMAYLNQVNIRQQL